MPEPMGVKINPAFDNFNQQLRMTIELISAARQHKSKGSN